MNIDIIKNNVGKVMLFKEILSTTLTKEVTKNFPGNALFIISVDFKNE